MSLIERARREQIVLVGVAVPPTTLDDAEASLDELAALVDTAGADEVERVLQRRDAPRPGHLRRQGQGRGAAGDVATRSTPTRSCSTTS